MKVHLNQIPPEGLHLEGEETGDILDLGQENIRSVSPLRYCLDVGLSNGGLFATGSLSIDLEMECVKCLQRFVYSLKVDSFAIQTELTGAELVDLTPLIREDIVLALPAHPHCDWDEKNVCRGAYELEKYASPEQAPNAWEALDQLKANLEK
jgi:uncharacterized protein